MYCSHFGLHRPPFNNTPDPSFYYSTPDHEEALATLQYATLNRKGFVLVTGEVGAGKTLIGRMFIRQIDRQASTAVITHTQLNARQLLAAICAEFELDVPAEATNLQLADRLQEYLLDQFARDRFVVVLLDEGQNLPDESFEALRMLGNLEADDAKLLQVCILGQPELRDRFKSEGMRQLDQRLFRRFHLAGLTEAQTLEYIQRRLTVAGCARSDLFSPEALQAIHRGADGIPRLINRVCDNALLAAYAQGRDRVDEAIIAQVLEQEGLVPACSPVPPAGMPKAAETTEERIEQIYGNVPLLVESHQESVAAAKAMEGLGELREVVNRTNEQWPVLREAIEHHRIDLQKSVDEATARCRQAEEQIETIGRTAAPAEALEELRRAHHQQTGRVMDEIAVSRSKIQSLMESIQERIAANENRIRDMELTSAGKDAVAHLERRLDEQSQEALACIDQHRHHVESLVQLLSAQCRQTETSLANLGDAQAQSQSEWVGRIDEKLNVLQSEWADRLDRSLADLNGRLAEQLGSAASNTDVQALRQAQQQARDELEQRLAAVRESLESELETAARREELEQLRRTTATASELTDVRDEVMHARAEAHTGQEAHGAHLAAHDEVLAGQETAIADIYVSVGRHEDEIRQISESVEARVSETDLNEQLASVRGEMAEALAETARRGELEQLRQSAATTSEVEQVRREALGATIEVRGELDRARADCRDHQARSAEDLARLSDRLAETGTAHRAELDTHRAALADQETALADIYVSVGRHEDEIRQLSREAADRFDALTSGLNELRESAAGPQLEAVRSEHEAFAREVLERFAEKASALDALKRALDERLTQAAGAQEASIAAVAGRVDAEAKQLRELRHKLVQSHAMIHQRLAALDERYASQAEVETLRQAQAAQSEQMLGQIQTSRQAVQNLIDELTDRFRATHQRLDALNAAAETDNAELAELRRAQAEDVASLLRQLEDQRRLSQEQFEQVLDQWNQSQQAIEALRASAADASALEALRQDQSRRSQEILQLIGCQRGTLEALIQAADRRCDAMLARLDALPANVASTGDVQALHEESRNNKTLLESAVRAVVEQCEQTACDLRGLQDHAASVDSHLEQIRQDHAQGLGEIVQRLDGQSSEYQQEFDALKERWSGLRTELQKLAGSAVPVEKFQAAERLINRDLNALKGRLDQIADRRQKDVRVLVDVVQRLNDRVKHLEELDRPQPVRVELRPRAAEKLAELNSAAELKAADLRKLLAQMNSVGEQLSESSSRIEQMMGGWSAEAGQVQAQSEQLRISAKASAGILQAMRKCHDAIDNKLKSAAWHGQMRRGEELTARLEQALPQYQQFEGVVNAWQEQRKDAEALVAYLERMLAEANRATARLGRVGAMMAGVAGKNSIAETVHAAREHDEQLRPTRGNGRRTSHPKVEPVAWPTYRSHMQANAG